jgi:hypothetical protein
MAKILASKINRKKALGMLWLTLHSEILNYNYHHHFYFMMHAWELKHTTSSTFLTTDITKPNSN